MTLSDMFRCSCWVGVRPAHYFAGQTCRQADGGRPAAAVLGEVGEQGVHGGIDRGVDERSPFACERHQFGVLQFLEMKSERGGGQPELFADLASSQPIFPGLNQQPVDIKAGLLCDRRQGR